MEDIKQDIYNKSKGPEELTLSEKWGLEEMLEFTLSFQGKKWFLTTIVIFSIHWGPVMRTRHCNRYIRCHSSNPYNYPLKKPMLKEVHKLSHDDTAKSEGVEII